MSAKIVLVALVVAVCSYANALPCNCGFGPGEDMCANGGNKPCSPLVVRPIELPRPCLPTGPKVICKTVGGYTPLAPIAGPCSCLNAIVKPASVPKPACLACSSCSGSQSSTSTATNYGDALVNFKPVGCYGNGRQAQAQTAPADAVSLALAYNMAQNSLIQNEDKLAFGFRKLPIELPATQKKSNNIREENLFSLNGQIVELKPVKAMSQSSLDEEAAEELLALDDEDVIEPVDIKKVSLGELGYGPAKIASSPFINVAMANEGQAVAEAEAAQAACADGFVPGAVVFNTVQKPQQIAVPVANSYGCDDVVEVQPQNGYYGGYYKTQSQKSSSTTQHHQSHNVMLHKLGACL